MKRKKFFTSENERFEILTGGTEIEIKRENLVGPYQRFQGKLKYYWLHTPSFSKPTRKCAPNVYQVMGMNFFFYLLPLQILIFMC